MDEGETLNKSNNSENQIGTNRRDTSTFGAVHSIWSDLTRTKEISDLHQNVSNSCDPIVSKLRENGHSTPTSKNQPIASIESYAAGSEKGRKGNVNQDNTLDSMVCSGPSSLNKHSRKSSTVKESILRYMKRQKYQ
ncbi:DNA-binding HORMA family protein [Artemisia annua]|uniref:DNA-binding HORMA family protein n=1 Tax=Artemisia annua TaxID=35608 RepID=A0A2U1M7I8_ARTAN|nr:DNA-binding HORMA family protein [Artemisia annua]